MHRPRRVESNSPPNEQLTVDVMGRRLTKFSVQLFYSMCRQLTVATTDKEKEIRYGEVAFQFAQPKVECVGWMCAWLVNQKNENAPWMKEVEENRAEWRYIACEAWKTKKITNFKGYTKQDPYDASGEDS